MEHYGTLFAKLPQFAFSEETVATAWRGAGTLQSCSTAALLPHCCHAAHNSSSISWQGLSVSTVTHKSNIY